MASSYTFPDKDPDDTLDYTVDWERWLNGADTISSVVWSLSSKSGDAKADFPTGTLYGLENSSESNTNEVCTINLAQGTAGKTYLLHCQITTVGALIAERTVQLKVREL